MPGGEQRGPAAQTVFRRTLLGIRPILFTHLVGSTERALALGDRGWHELLEEHNARLRELLARYEGRELHMAGARLAGGRVSR